MDYGQLRELMRQIWEIVNGWEHPGSSIISRSPFSIRRRLAFDDVGVEAGDLDQFRRIRLEDCLNVRDTGGREAFERAGPMPRISSRGVEVAGDGPVVA